MFIETLINGLALGGVYALVALGFTLIFGVLKLFHVSHGDVLMFSGYIVYTVITISDQVHFIVLLLIGVISAAVLGFLVERLAFKPYRKSFHIIPLISGIGVSLILQNLALIIWEPGQKNFSMGLSISPLQLGDITISGVRIVIFISVFVIMLLFNYWLFHTRSGRAVRATANDSETARMMGIKTERIYILTFVVGSILAGAAAVLTGSLYGAIFPSFGFSMGIKAFAAAILGGLGSMSGAVIGGLVLGVLEVFTAAYINISLQDVVSMGILILVLLLRPKGILGKTTEEKL
ncbi:branched-chain amino acid ABC transporter permease [Bacillus niameyensis]|uniref:branched-chain amino acid ABC transporter permease n=1 Tax=Bacillus niameyensis TaxID=1522308 RepID=UPI000782B400|nr:branched-chain amino acid ABC transporter permease [Bacillus niameyensis]